MLSIIQDIPDFVLSSQLDIIIECDEQMTFSLYKDKTVILQETYTPDFNNRIHIYDLFLLLEPYLLENPLCVFSYLCDAPNEWDQTPKFFTVLLCRHLIFSSATDFVNGYFLTALAGRDKITSFDRVETLYMTTGRTSSGGTSIPVNAECVFVSDSNKIYNSVRSLGSVSDYGINSIDVSPSRFKQSGYKLLRYTVTAGARKQVYRLDHDEQDSICIKFRNSFGCIETFYFSGIEKIEPELTRSAAYFNGTYRTYHIEELRKHTLSTGYIPESMYALVDDVARSQEVYLIDGSEEIPITIIDSETQRDTSNDGLFSFTITYILSSRCQNRLKLLPDIFDDTFDDTYN